ncbi:MAG: 2-phospho-L-lactate guanylyltransferase [Pseudomonadota bacterium]
MLQVFLALKNPQLAKSRLSVALADEQRIDLVQAMALDVIDVVLAGDGPLRLTVIAPMPWKALLPRSPRLNFLSEETLSGAGLNPLLREAVEAEKPGRAVVLHGDLPFLDAHDVRVLTQRLDSHSLVLCPDSTGKGTNGLGFKEPGEPAFRFGPDSFMAHRRCAEALRCRWTALERPGFARDVDTPGDLLVLLQGVASGENVGARTALWVRRYGGSVRSALETQASLRFPCAAQPPADPSRKPSSPPASADPELQGFTL